MLSCRSSNEDEALLDTLGHLRRSDQLPPPEYDRRRRGHVRGAARERYRKLLAPTPRSPPPGDRRVIVGEDLDEGDRVLISSAEVAKRAAASPHAPSRRNCSTTGPDMIRIASIAAFVEPVVLFWL